MINTFFSAKLTDYNTIRVAIFSSVAKDTNVPIILYDNHGFLEKLNIVNQSFLNGLVIYECKSKDKLDLGVEYSIGIESFGMTPLDVNDAVFFNGFDDEFYYPGDDLGSTYHKEYTLFKVWAPLASKVVLMIKNPYKDNSIYETYKMERGKFGVHYIKLNGDFENYLYRYQVTNSGTTNIVIDPYAKGSNANGKNSVVIDLNKTKMDLYSNVPPVYKNYVDTILYELHIRDFTIDSSTNIKNKGKFLGLTEEGIKTKKGLPVGLDYLKSLNITHVQLLPVLDYKTVDELNPDKSYNWGYDPQQYFALEGSYSTNPEDAYSRIIEFKKLIQTLHKAGIRVNLDVVYNHVYDYQTSTLERIVPNYYFRRKKNGLISNGTGCGNDLASEKLMVRKLIIDSLKYLLKEFEVDGFRFDLLGITDLETTKLIVSELRKINPNIMLYGEGWDMATELSSEKKTTIYNSFKVPEVGFFNDSYRDIVRGHNFSNERGYLLGNLTYLEGFKFVYLGSCVNYCYPPRFLSANQSINYVECHDNSTLFDKIEDYYGTNLPLEEKLRLVNLVNGVIAFSLGVPFYHAGQEIGLTKYHHDNTYNLGDKYNMFRWSLLDERMDNYLYFKSILDCRRNYFAGQFYSPKLIRDSFKFINLHDGCFSVQFEDCSKNTNEQYVLVINPTKSNCYISLNDYYNVIVGIGGVLKNSNIYTQNLCIEPYSTNILKKKI